MDITLFKEINASQCIPNSELEKAIANYNETDSDEAWSELMDILSFWTNTGGTVLAPVHYPITEETSSDDIGVVRLTGYMTEDNKCHQECYTSIEAADKNCCYGTIGFEDFLMFGLEDCETIDINPGNSKIYLEIDKDDMRFLLGENYRRNQSEVMRLSFLHGLYKKDDPEGKDNSYPSIAIFPNVDVNHISGPWRMDIAYTMIHQDSFLHTIYGFGDFNEEEKRYDAVSGLKVELEYREDAVGKVGLKISDASSDDMKDFIGTYRKVAKWNDVLKHWPFNGMATIDKWKAL